MTSNDVRDVLNIPSEHPPAPRPSKRHRTGAPRPNLKGLAREVQNLGGDNPIAIVPDLSFFKKRRFVSRKPAARWELKPFTNSARSDDGALVLRHWKRKTENGPPPEAAQDGEPLPSGDAGEPREKDDGPEDSAFAKFNVRVSVPQYNDDQYQSNLQSDDWTREETDYLMELARDYDLRWPVIWDRYEFAPRPPHPANGADGTSTAGAVVPAPRARTMEELKARYYEVAARMMAVQKPAQYMTRPEFELYEMMQNFNPEQERKRKEFAVNTMARSRDEAREEESLLLEIKRILARTERFNEERRELYNRLDYPATDADINSFKTSAGLQALLQNLMSNDKPKKRKSILGPGDGVSPGGGGGAPPSSAVSDAGAHRRESIAAASANRRESDARGARTSAEPTPTTGTPASGGGASAAAAAAAANKKKGAAGAPPERRKLSAQEEQIYGVSYHERLGSGPTFRYEKINKLYSHKSGQQQMRITNALSELDVPPRLAMPTAAVTAQFEVLWGAVTALVDLRKLSDKLDAEIKLEEAKKAERDRARGIVAPPPGEGGAEGEGKGNEPGETHQSDREGTSGEMGQQLEGEKEEKKEKDGDAAPNEAGDSEAGAPTSAAATTAAATGPQQSDEDRAGAGEGGEGGGEVGDGAPAGIKQEPGAEKESTTAPAAAPAAAARPGSSGGGGRHKRSASVLSVTSDKSTKRLKK